MSWDEFEDRRRRDRERAEQAQVEKADPERDRLFARVFGTTEGQQALRYLRDLTIERPTSPHYSESALRHLEGQRNFVRMIEGWVAHGREAK